MLYHSLEFFRVKIFSWSDWTVYVTSFSSIPYWRRVRNKLFNSTMTISLFIWEQDSVKTQKHKRRSQFHKLLHQSFHSTLFDRTCQMRTFNIEILSMSVIYRVLWKETLWKVAGGDIYRFIISRLVIRIIKYFNFAPSDQNFKIN